MRVRVGDADLDLLPPLEGEASSCVLDALVACIEEEGDDEDCENTVKSLPSAALGLLSPLWCCWC